MRLINANGYKASLTKWKDDAWKHNERHDAMLIADCLCELEAMPTVDAVEVVHGRWKAHKPDCRGYTASFICSCCEDTIYTDYCMKECEYNYCPNCGAKMDGDGNG